MVDLPIVMSPTGPIPTPPSTIRAGLDTAIKTTNPDYTSNLPGSLVEDVLSTDVAACVVSDQFRIDLINSVTPLGANPFLLSKLGAIYGEAPGEETNTSVYVTFNAVSTLDGTTPVPGIVIGQGFIVSDGTYQYICPDGGVTGTDGNTLPVYAVSTMPGSWGIPEGTVNQLISAPPDPFKLTVTVNNFEVGTPAAAAETITQYRSRVLTSGLAASTGMSRLLRTFVSRIPGVQQRLVSVRQDLELQGYDIIVGGGDPYQIGYAIWQAVNDTTCILPNDIPISGITNSNPCQITTGVRHYLTTGMHELISKVSGPSVLNGVKYPVTVIDAYTVSIPADTTGEPTYLGGGYLSPNPIVESPIVSDYPDTFKISFTNPPLELVSIVITWATNSPFFVSAPAVAQKGNQPIVDYINSLNAGIDPINIVNLQSIFTRAVASILSPQYIDALTVSVSINGIGVTPLLGTNIIPGDPNSYFFTTNSGVVIQQAT